MNAKRNILFALVTALSLGVAVASAQAHPGGMGSCGQGMMGPGMGPGMGGGRMGGMGAGNMAANVDANLDAVKTRLAITPDQEAAWQTYAGKVKEQAQRMQTLRESRPGQTLTGPERQAFHASMMKQRAEEMEAIAAASKGLYAVLTPQQKTAFDACPGAMAGRGMRGRNW